MAIVVFVVLVFTTATMAQPTELTMNVMDVGQGVTTSFVIPSSGSRDVPLPAVGIFEFTCQGSSAIPKKPWHFVNSSDMSESIEDILKADLESVTNGSVVQYSKTSNSWALRLVNASDMYGVFECITEYDMVSINIIESNPAILMSDTEYMPTLNQAGFLMQMFITGNPHPDSTSLTLYFNDQKISKDDFGYSLGLTLFSIFSISSDRHGKYTIEVSNNEGSANASFLLTIRTPAKAEITTSHDIAYVGESFQLNCTTTSGFPAPDYDWNFKGDEILSGENGYMIENHVDRSVLTIPSVAASHAGNYRCVASNGVATDNKFFNLEVYLPSPSPPALSLVSNYLLYAGVETVLNCTTVFTDSIHDMKDVNVTWQRGNDTIYIDNVVASMREDTSLHVSLLTILSASSSDSGSITCIVTVYDDNVTSIGVPSNEFALEIENPPIDISVNPQATQVIAVSPYNAITLNCTAFAPVTTATQYRWYLNDALLLNNTDRVTITDDKESSILTDSPSTHGTLSYTCEYVINTNPPLKRNTSAVVTVQGPVQPNVPVRALSETLSYNKINIKFTITDIAYDREQYYIIYGTSSDNLDMKSTTVSGNTQLDMKDEEFEIILSYLDHNTVYYFRVVANNSQGFTMTSVKTFQTPKILLVQIKAGPFQGCDKGRVLDSTDVKTFLNEKLSERISETCDCSFPQDNLVNGSLYCSAEASSTLIYRVNVLPTTDIDASSVVTHLEQSLKSDRNFVSGVATISVDLSCNLSISSLVDPLCVSPVTETITETCNDSGSVSIDSSTLVLASVIGGCLIALLLIIIVVMGIMICYQHKRLKRMGIKRTSNQYSVVNCRRETSFIDHKPSPPAIAAPAVPTSTQQWEGDVSISDCPAYLYSVKPLNNEPPQTIVERQPTPGIYDSIDGLNNAGGNGRGFQVAHQLPNSHQSKINCEPITNLEDYASSSDDLS